MAPSELPIEHAEQLIQLLPRLMRWARDQVSRAGADLNLSMRQYSALRGIREGARTAKDLARQWLVTPAVVTGVIDRLERRGLVRREADPTDRRRVSLTLTAKGLEMSHSVDAEMARDLAAHLAGATPSDLLALGRTLSVLDRALGPVKPAAAPSPSREAPSASDKTGPRRPTRRADPGARPRRVSRRTTR